MGRFSELYQLSRMSLYPPKGLIATLVWRIYVRESSVIHLIDAGRYEALMTTDGSPLPEQIREADVVVVRGDGVVEFASPSREYAKKKVIQAGSLATLKRTMGTKSLSSTAILLIATSIFTILVGAKTLFQLQTSELESIAVIFLSILLQGLPFLTLGVLIASAIQILCRRDF